MQSSHLEDLGSWCFSELQNLLNLYLSFVTFPCLSGNDQLLTLINSARICQVQSGKKLCVSYRWEVQDLLTSHLSMCEELPMRAQFCGGKAADWSLQFNVPFASIGTAWPCLTIGKGCWQSKTCETTFAQVALEKSRTMSGIGRRSQVA